VLSGHENFQYFPLVLSGQKNQPKKVMSKNKATYKNPILNEGDWYLSDMYRLIAWAKKIKNS
jgi:hypothetical protein